MDEVVAPDSPAAATEIKQSWVNVSGKHKGVNRILRKFSVAELYKITIEVAEEILTPKQQQEFLKRLTTRLSK